MLIQFCDLCTEEIPIVEVVKRQLMFQHSYVCESCLAQFRKIKWPFCNSCGVHMKKTGANCSECERWLREKSDKIDNFAIFEYNNIMQSYLRAYKFEGGYHLRLLFKKIVLKVVKQSKVDLIVPIPVHMNTYEKRGYNQVEGLLGSNYTRLLVKSSESKIQSIQGRSSRLTLKNPFEVNLSLNISPEKKLCIVDDVYTTGTTLRHAYQALRGAGFKEICSVTLARSGFLKKVY